MTEDTNAATVLVGESGPEVMTIKKPRTVNHAAKCRKAWDAFHDAAVAASEAGVVVELTFTDEDGDHVQTENAKQFTASITANY